MKIVTVIPLGKGIWKDDLTYFTSKDVPHGSIVKISIRKKEILGIVVASENVSEIKSDIKNMSFNLKKILEVKENSLLTPEFLKSGIQVAHYFVAKPSVTFTHLIPASFREEYHKIVKSVQTTNEALTKIDNIASEKLLFQASPEDRISFYKNIIRGAFAQKKSVFIVLPTESDITAFEENLSKGIENFTFSIHGTLSAKKQIEKFQQISSCTHPVLILGTAPFLCIPRTDVGTIILEHESSSAYKMIARPYMDLRVFAEIYAKNMGIKFIMGDTLLSFGTIARKRLNGLTEMHPLSFRIHFDGEISILPHHKLENRGFQSISDEVLEKISENLKQNKNVFIFSLRKGLATETLCKDCGKSVTCQNCSAPITLYLSRDGKKRMFVCNKCKAEKPSDTVCENCGGWNLIPLGIGTDTVFEKMKKNFPDNKIFKLDKESIKTKKGAEKVVKDFENTKGNILVGTEMAFFYLREKVALSVIASFDSLWSIPNFKISEKIIHLILSTLSITENKLLIQTKNEKDGALRAISSKNLLEFATQELQIRQKLNYPPFQRFIKITYAGDKTSTFSAKKYLSEVFKEYNPDIFSGFVPKVKEKYITNALIKIPLEKWPMNGVNGVNSADSTLFSKLSTLPQDFAINVDPEDLL